MARPLRIEYAGAVYHLTGRGNRQEKIFLDDDDRSGFLEILEKTVHRYNWLCYAYCMMDNHYHLLIETLDANLSLGMRQLNGMYTQFSNRKHGKVGHVFQGRFKSILVEKDAHLLELCRYIVLNPTRVKMVDHPGKWQWSSYNATSKRNDVPAFLSIDWLLAQFSKQKTTARKCYITFIAEGCKEPSPWEKIVGQTILGSESFVEKMQAYLTPHKANLEIPKSQRQAGRPQLTELIPISIRGEKKNRNRAIIVANLEYGYTLKQIADLLGIHYTTVSKVISSHHR